MAIPAYCDLKFDDTTGKYYWMFQVLAAKDGVYEVTVAADGKSHFNWHQQDQLLLASLQLQQKMLNKLSKEKR